MPEDDKKSTDVKPETTERANKYPAAGHDTALAADTKAPAAVPKAESPRKTELSPDVPKLAQRALIPLVVVLLGFGGGWLGAYAQNKNNTSSQSANVETQRVIMNEQGDLISSIAEDVGKSVVSINVTSRTTTSSYFGYGRTSEQESAGTGVIISSDGLVLTNRHVVPSGTTDVSVVLSDGTELDDVEVVDRTSDDDSLDVAFLKINDTEGKSLTAAKLGDSSNMRVGDSVVAIGNALGYFQNTVTTGIISGYGRSIQASGGSGSETESLEDLFQTDAAINQGNSGGPLVNVSGEVIGINTAVASGGAENIGFAIPINNISGLIDGVKTTGKIQRPFLGVVYVPVTSDLRSEFDLKVSDGAYVPKASDYGDETVVSDGPAAKAGIKEGDVITAIGDTKIDSSTSLSAALSKHKSGDKVTVTVNRAGSTEKISVTLGTRP